MRCTSIKENKCWNRIEFELTSNSIRFPIDLFHINVVYLTFLERIGLDRSFNFLFRALICIMPHLLVFEAFNLTDVSLNRLTPTATTITTMVALMSTLVVLVLVIIMTMVVLVVMMAVVAVVVVVLSMFVGSGTPTIIMMGTLVRRS